jgi:hypothetical protein
MAFTKIQSDGLSQTAISDNLGYLPVGMDSTTGAASLPVGTTAQRPSSPAVGMVRYNTDLNYLEEYRQGQWVPASNVAEGSVVQTVFKKFSDVTTISSNNNFYDVSNGHLDIVSRISNSKFLVTMIGQGYQASGGGVNLGIKRTIATTATRLMGVDGGSGNTWMGAGNGAPSISYTITRSILDTPNVIMGTTIQYRMLVGGWSSGTIYLNYSGYTGESAIIIQEIAP